MAGLEDKVEAGVEAVATKVEATVAADVKTAVADVKGIVANAGHVENIVVADAKKVGAWLKKELGKLELDAEAVEQFVVKFFKKHL